MSNPYVGEIRMFGGNFAPMGWLFCNGDILSISDYETLFMLIGTTYGGDGQTNFALPDLRGRLPIHQGQGQGQALGFTLGQLGGAETVSLVDNQIPVHTHALMASSTPANSTQGSNNLIGQADNIRVYSTDVPTVPMAPTAIASVGSGQAHSNMQPYLCVNFIISYSGIFPSQS